jgi:DNA-binding FadR family transcriptional regulator
VLERVRNRGTTVCRVCPERLGEDLALCVGLAGFGSGELKEVRQLIEDAAADLAARRLAPAAAARLRDLIDRMAAEREPEAADRLDRDFHLALVEACGNPCLSLFAGVIQTLFHRSHRAVWRNRAAAAKSVADHRAILAALEAGDGERARRLLREHIEPT